MIPYKQAWPLITLSVMGLPERLMAPEQRLKQSLILLDWRVNIFNDTGWLCECVSVWQSVCLTLKPLTGAYCPRLFRFHSNWRCAKLLLHSKHQQREGSAEGVCKQSKETKRESKVFTCRRTAGWQEACTCGRWIWMSSTLAACIKLGAAMHTFTWALDRRLSKQLCTHNATHRLVRD